MRKIILIFVIQSLYYIARVESLVGENTTPVRGGEFPFIASLLYFPEGNPFCGGALIAKKHVITSAHCLTNQSPEDFRIGFEVARAQGPALIYTVASWTTYTDWARSKGIQYDNLHALHIPAIVTLTDRVYHVNPVPLNQLTKGQLNGRKAKMIGWENEVLSKATVKLLSDKDCERSIREIGVNGSISADDRFLYSAANPFALFSIGDIGSPLIHARDKSLLGLANGYIPTGEHVRGNFPTELMRQHQVNVHVNVQHYRLFIHSVIPAAPGA